jgi:hypothetical protein
MSRSIMRTLVTLVSLTLLAPAALADRAGAQTAARAPAAPRAVAPPMVQLAAIDGAAIPAPCTPLAKQALADATSVVATAASAALSARISLASCMADHAVAPIALCDCGASIVAVDQAVKPATDVLDDVIAKGDPATQVMAEHAEGQLYTGLVARLVATLPKVGPQATESEVALHDMRKQTLDAQLAPWRETALTSFQHVVELSKAHPELARNAVIATAVRDSQQQLSAEVAAR